MVKLSLNQIKQLCTSASFERGQRYLEEGRVKIREASPSRITASVAGTRNYRVQIDLGGKKGISATCTCPYDWEGYCKHIVATLLAMLEDKDAIEDMVEASSERQKSIGELLEEVDPEALRSFLHQEMERHLEIRDRFMACFSPSGGGKSLDEYKSEVDSLYEVAEDRGFVPYGENIDFDPLKDLAEIYIGKGDFTEAAKIYQALFETIAKKMNSVDDSDGFYGGEFSNCLMAFVECISEAELDAKAKRKCIDYLFSKYLQRKPDYFQDDYDDALRELCASEEDLRYWKELLEKNMHKKQIPEKMPDKREDWSSYWQAKELISMQLYVLSRLKEAEEFYSLMEMNYRSSKDLCLMYAQRLLKDGDREKAVMVAEEGLALFPDHASRGLREFLSEVYRDYDQGKYKETLMSLFFLTRDWKYYEQLKIISPSEEWLIRLDEVLAHFSKDNRDMWMVIDIYLREQMHEQALREVLALKSLSTLSRYYKELASRYPDQYFSAYRDLITPFAGKETGRKHYRKVVSYLKEMKAIGGFEGDIKEIVERLREKHKRQPAFIDEIKGL